MPAKTGSTKRASSDEVAKLLYAQHCLSYTLRTNQINEARLSKLLTVALGALTGCAFLIDRIAPNKGSFIEGMIFFALIFSAIMIITSMLMLIQGITPKLVDGQSTLLNDYVAGKPVQEYVDEIAGHDSDEACRALLRENAAMARVVLARQHAYINAKRVFFVGALLLILSTLGLSVS